MQHTRILGHREVRIGSDCWDVGCMQAQLWGWGQGLGSALLMLYFQPALNAAVNNKAVFGVMSTANICDCSWINES